MSKESQILAFTLKITGIILITAFFAVFLPMDTMDQIHRWLGLGPMPQGQIVEYLARTVSLFYTFTGVILWYIARDIAKYIDFIRFYLWVSYPFGLALFFTDLAAGMPPYWKFIEGPLVLGLITILMILQHRARRSLTVKES